MLVIFAVAFAVVMVILAKPNRKGEPPREEQSYPVVNDALFGCSTIVWLLIALATVAAVASAFGMVDLRMEPPY